jgi:serine/threonine protein kinase
MRCSSCGQDNSDDRKFCAGCGALLNLDCSACGFHNQPGARFCGSCGKSIGAAAASPTPPAKPRGPESFVNGRYKVIRSLGEGGSKTVYLARDMNLDREVAFALIRTPGLDEAGRERIAREARAMGRLGDHANIVDVYDVGEEQGQPYIVSQYMAGGSVEELLGRSDNHSLSITDAVRIADEVCQALEYAHSLGVVHRDIKPANVWLTRAGKSKLGDFGLAVARELSRLTASGVMVGTVAYMAPEQVQGKPPEPRSDLYSLGAMLFEMLTGRPPFRGDDLISVITQHLNATPEKPSQERADVPPALDSLVLDLLGKKPEDRPESASAVRGRLKTVTENLGNTIDRLAKSVAIERPNLSINAAADGTVSILFSDIENSTVMYDRLGDVRAQELLHVHNTIIREQVALHRGREVKSMGDGFMVVFASARRALRCAIAIQSAFEAYSNEHPQQPIRVRIGLHVGEAIKESDDFFGTAVIMAARVGATAEAGEILVSSVFREVTRSLSDVGFDPGREVALKGLSGTHRVYRALWNESKKPCPSCKQTIPAESLVCPLCMVPISFETSRPPTAQFDAHRETVSAARASSGMGKRIGAIAAGVILLAAAGYGAYRFGHSNGEQAGAAPEQQPAQHKETRREEAQKQKEAQKQAEAQDKAEAQKDEAQRQAEAQKQAEALKQAEAAKQVEAEKQTEAQKQAEAQKAAEAQKQADAQKQAEAQKQAAAEKQKQEEQRKAAEELARKQKAAEQAQKAEEKKRLAEAAKREEAQRAAQAQSESATTPDQKLASVAPASATKKVSTKVPSKAKGKYSIEVDDSMERDDADEMASRLLKLGYNAYLVPQNEGGESLWRIRVGPYKTEDEASDAEEQLHQRYQAAYPKD